MEEELQHMWNHLTLAEEEQYGARVDNEADEMLKEKGKHCLFGKVLTAISFNKVAFKRTMKMAWGITKVEIKEVGDNLFLIKFNNMLDKTRVMEGMPWSFDNHLVLLTEYEGSIQASSITFERCPFWVQIYNLPFNSMKQSTGESIGKRMGKCLKTELQYEGVGWGRYLRIRVCLDVEKPLLWSLNLMGEEGHSFTVFFKYKD